VGRSEAKAGNELALGKAGEEVVLLLGGAVAHQQFAGAEGVGHGDGARGRVTAGRNLLHHLAVTVSTEALAPVLLRDDHAEKALLLAVVPKLLGKVAVLRNLVIVQQLTQLLYLLVQKRLLLGRGLDTVLLQVGELGVALEDVSVKTNRPRIQRRTLRLTYLGHHRLGDLVAVAPYSAASPLRKSAPEFASQLYISGQSARHRAVQ
jgi:hypothetical protein